MHIVTASEQPLTPIRSRPAPLAGFDGDAARVVRMPERGATTGPGATVATDGTALPAHLLDPVKAERALVAEMAKKIGQAALEVINGARSIQQLARWLDPKSFEALAVRARLAAAAEREAERRLRRTDLDRNVHTLHHQPMVHSVHCSPVVPGVYETSLVVADMTRVRAIAMRFEESQGTWKVTALQIG